MENTTMEKHLDTEQLAQLLHIKAGTIRRGLCVNGHYMNIRPVKLPNGRLIWPSEPVEKLLSGEAMR